ncbi:hypothetical protein D0T84_19495 [Dysgonomonas sp. 521]|uniref:hypothetical protein n=1 Tax=Dysgonomonas sp. 521 TaxID=2302932 RepID=UPI0013D102E8|nr:hypothetical protein [Dysgonomonas sp. 521]NDV97072.1 hypothetical protein [Dysgonomonas sp. 521]
MKTTGTQHKIVARWRLLAATAAFLLCSSFAGAQVTIGSVVEPTRAALLDLKARQTTSGTVTSISDDNNLTAGLGDGGLLLPRVKLVNIKTLEPFIAADDAEFLANTNSLKEKLAGLMVYNLTDNGAGSTLYPAVYTWNGVVWTTSQTNEALSSIIIQPPKAFSFYETGNETVKALEFVVKGLGVWTFQWYQIMGNNVHVRIEKPIDPAGVETVGGAVSDTKDGTKATAFFTPTGVIKKNKKGESTTRDANNTGFYRFYCVATSSLGAELTSDIAEVAVGCGAKNNKGEWLSFMCFNLGATLLTIDDQINYSMTFSRPNEADGGHYYIAGEENLYGDLYQWGRIGDGHEKRGAAQGFESGKNTAGTNQIAYGAGPEFEDGNLIDTQPYPYRQVKRGTSHYGKFIISSAGQNYNWAYYLSASEIDLLWRTGRFEPNDPCAKIKDDGLNYETYYPDTDGISGADTGWRTPNQNEWGELYRGGTITGSSTMATANTWVWNNTNGRGYEIKPDGKTTTLFLPASAHRSRGTGLLLYQGTLGNYWSTTVVGVNAYALFFNSVDVNPANSNNSRAYGFALRCIKDN